MNLEKRHAAIRVIASLAYDIRGDWNQYVPSRCRMIDRLSEDYHIDIPEIDEEEACYDGRWFRDVWSDELDAPYGAECTRQDLELLGLDEDIFNYPDQSMAA